MSTRFNPHTTPRKTPPWCKPGMYPFIPPVVDGKPTYLTTFLQWKDIAPGHYCDVTASLDLLWSAGASAWEAHQLGDGFKLGGRVWADVAPNEFICRIDLYVDGSWQEEHLWTGVVMGPDFPWDSGNLELVTDPCLDRQTMQVTA